MWSTHAHLLQRQHESPTYTLMIVIKPAFYFLKVWFLYQTIYQLILHRLNVHTAHPFLIPSRLQTEGTVFSWPMLTLGFKTKLKSLLFQDTVFDKPRYIRIISHMLHQTPVTFTVGCLCPLASACPPPSSFIWKILKGKCFLKPFLVYSISATPTRVP